MQQQTSRKPQPFKKPMGWLPAMWYVDIMGIIAGLLLGATAGLYLAKPFFDRGEIIPGIVYTAFSIGIALAPVITVVLINRMINKLRFPADPDGSNHP